MANEPAPPSFDQLLSGTVAVPADRDATKLLAFISHEMQLFFAHCQKASAQYAASGELPNSVFKGKYLKVLGRGAARVAKSKGGKRKPSAFNLFVKHTMAEFKEKGVTAPKTEEGPRNPLFTLAVAEWQKLTQEEKDVFTAKLKAEQAEAGSADVSQAAEEEEEEGGEEAEGGEEEDEEDEEDDESD